MAPQISETNFCTLLIHKESTENSSLLENHYHVILVTAP